MGIVEQYLLQLNTKKRRWHYAVAILTVLSVVVAFLTVWNLRMTGLTIANSAACGQEEHMHTEECFSGEAPCEYEEHIHSTDCYSDPSADTETPFDWSNMFSEYPYTGVLREDLVGIAKTQVGYTESRLNFELREDGTRRGYTRYGEWYGAPYNDWSAMFVSFCLSFAGADGEEFPFSSGGATMSELWKRQEIFAPAGEYTPQSGDVVFFDNNTVGIVTEVYNATFYMISANTDDSVSESFMPLDDPSITGWGITKVREEIFEEEIPEIRIPEEIPDVTNGPVINIYEGGLPPLPTTVMRTYSRRATRAVIDLLTYLETNGGSYFYTLLDHNNMELPKDENGNYVAHANTGYKLTVSFTSPKGFTPGTYQYQTPNGLMVDGGTGEFILKDGTRVGTWEVTDTGLITLNFNEEMNSRTEITISATLGIRFPEQNEPIDFDGKITVTVEKPPEQEDPTAVLKWGQQGKAENGQDPTKLYWTVQVTGNRDSQIPGNILSDEVLFGEWSKNHHYTESDIAGGLTFGVSEPDPVTGEFKDWHAWHVSPDDPHLIWTDTGWSYKMPESATCQWCGEVILGNENWIYTINYTSTPDPTSNAGTYGYENQVSIDGQHAYAWTDFTHGETHGEITKSGSFVSNTNEGNFAWEFQAMIPGIRQWEKADYHWYIMDYMYLLNSDSIHSGHIENDAHLSKVTVVYNGTTIEVPTIEEASDSDLFAWDNAWTATTNGINYGREISLLCKCACNETNCQFWNGKCEKYWFDRGDGVYIQKDFCQCWTPEENLTFTFVYTTPALPIIEAYGGQNYKLQNVAELHYKPTGTSEGALVSSSSAALVIPGLFKKELTHDFDGYTAHYRVTVNESKAVLTNGTPLTIHDVMTDTLAYISGSLVITTENTSGEIVPLRYGTDYTVTYDGTGNLTDENGKRVHVLDIVILKPQPVMYILDYDATLIMPEQVTGGIKYANSASISLWGEDITDNGVEKVYADINIAAKTYAVDMYKFCSITGKPLEGAVFGLYNVNGGLITSGTTDKDGKLSFETNVVEGIILREHELYYLQELRPPPAYRLDDTKHWFCFCNKTGDHCGVCENFLANSDSYLFRIPYEQVGIVNISNYPAEVDLPMTGGNGNQSYILCGLIICISSLVYGLSLRRKKERRSGD